MRELPGAFGIQSDLSCVNGLTGGYATGMPTKQRPKPSVIGVLAADHRALERVFTELERSAGSPEHRRQLVDHAIAEIARHAVTDAQHLYPVASQRLRSTELPNLRAAQRTMTELEHLSPASPRFEQLVSRLIAETRAHFRAERRLLPSMRSVCSSRELRELGEKLLHAKEISPVCEHPTAPPVPNPVIVAGTGIVAQVKDALT